MCVFFDTEQTTVCKFIVRATCGIVRRFFVKSDRLLELMANNPVVLAHASVPAGTYKQIRLVLDDNTSISITDGTTHPLTVPSGEQTGIKIDGVFEVPAGKLYTLDIDLDPGRSVHYAPGNGYMLKPVITLTGSDINSGNFYYAGTAGGDAFVAALSTGGSLSAKTARYPKYVINGYYVHDGVHQKLTVVPQEVTCPGCSRWERLKMKLFTDVPPATIYDVLTFGADYINLREPGSGVYHPLFRVPTFSLGYTSPSKEFTVQVTIPNALWAGKTLFAMLIPENEEGRIFSAVDTIPDSLVSSFDFVVPKSDFIGTNKDYVMLMVVVESQDDLTLLSDGTVESMRNLVAQNTKNAVRLHVSRDVVPPAPVRVPFIASTSISN